MPNPLGMDFTGERYVPERGWAAIAYEHLARYLFSAAPASGRRVLDVGSGEGYGARLLAETAASVVGVDVSQEAVSHAAAKYAAGRANLAYRRASATALPFPAASFDLVTCFEMLEHIAEHEALTAELRRVLRPGGVLLISTPNKHAYSDAPGYRNEFHVRELYYPEFRMLLEDAFPAVRIFSQKNVTGALIAPVDESAPAPLRVQRIRRASERNEFEPTAPESIDHLYYVAACSDDPAALRAVVGSVVVDRDERLAREAGEAGHADAQSLRREAEEARAAARAAASAPEDNRPAPGARDVETLVRPLLAEATAPADACGPEEGDYDILLYLDRDDDGARANVEALLRCTDPRHAIRILDARPEGGADWPERFAAGRREVACVRATPGAGPAAAYNAAFGASARDLVLATADAVFTSGWLARLDRCRRSDGRIGVVAPLCEADLPAVAAREDAATPELAALLAATSPRRYPRAPAAPEHCRLLTRAALRAAGPLDAAFGDAPGAEIDHCQRLWGAGFECAVCDDAYVPRSPAAASADSLERLRARLARLSANERLLATRWPALAAADRDRRLLNPHRSHELRILVALRAAAGGPARRVLHVAGPTPTDFAPWVGPEFDAVLLRPADFEGDWDAALGEERGALVLRANAAVAAASRGERAPLFERFFAETALGAGAAIVHFHDLAAPGGFGLPRIARALGARVVVTVRRSLIENGDGGPDAMSDARRRRLRDALTAADLVIAPSEADRRAVAEALGRDLADHCHLAPGPEDALALYRLLAPAPDAATSVIRERMRRQFAGREAA